MQKNKALFIVPLFSLFIFMLFIICLFTNSLFTIILFTYLVLIYLAFTYLGFIYLAFIYLSGLLFINTLIYPLSSPSSCLLHIAVLPVITSQTLDMVTLLEVVEILSTTSLRISSICLIAFCLDILIYVVATFLRNVSLAVNLDEAFLHQVKLNITLNRSTTQACFGTQLLQWCLTIATKNG